MKLNSLNFALAGAITTAVAWIICSLFVWTMPEMMMNTTGHMVHMDMSKFGWILSPFGFVWGLVVWSLLVGIFAWLMATIYNMLNKD